jgi:heterodisulfide reductase subunit C
MGGTAAPVDVTVARAVAADLGENVYKCYQCKRCTAGCPVAPLADMHPAQIIRAVQLGDLEAAVSSKFIWLCTGCVTCSTRCPQEIDVAGVMDELRAISWQEGLVPRDRPFADILQYNFDSITRWGRLYEIELIARYKFMRPRTMMDDALLGMKMFAKGKLSLRPALGDRRQMKRMVAEADRIEAERGAARGGVATPLAPAPGGGAR